MQLTRRDPVPRCRRRFRRSAFVIVAVAPGCATPGTMATTGHAVPDTSTPAGYRCEARGGTPATAASEVIDSVAVRTALLEVSRQLGSAAPIGPTVVWFASEHGDSIVPPRVARGSIPEPTANLIVDALTPHLIHDHRGGGFRGIRLMMAGEPSFRLIHRSEMCAPRLLNKDGVQQTLTRLISRYATDPGRVTATIWSFVETDGSVSKIRIEKSSGDLHIDDMADLALREGRWVPALVADVPLAAWVSLPVTVRLPF